MTDGSRLKGCGDASSHAETTPTPAGAAVSVGEADAEGAATVAVRGAVAGEAGAEERAANAACPLGDAAAVAELGASAELGWLSWHPAVAAASAAHRASTLNACFTSLRTRYPGAGCNTYQSRGERSMSYEAGIQETATSCSRAARPEQRRAAGERGRGAEREGPGVRGRYFLAAGAVTGRAVSRTIEIWSPVRAKPCRPGLAARPVQDQLSRRHRVRRRDVPQSRRPR